VYSILLVHKGKGTLGEERMRKRSNSFSLFCLYKMTERMTARGISADQTEKSEPSVMDASEEKVPITHASRKSRVIWV